MAQSGRSGRYGIGGSGINPFGKPPSSTPLSGFAALTIGGQLTRSVTVLSQRSLPGLRSRLEKGSGACA